MRFSHPLNRKPACEQAVLSGAHRSILVAVLCLYHTFRWTAAEDADLCYSTHVQMLINDTRESTVVFPFQERLRVSTFPFRNKEYRGCNRGFIFYPYILRLWVSLKFTNRLDRDRARGTIQSLHGSWQKTSMWLWPCHAWMDIRWMVWPTPSTRHLKWRSQDWHYLVQPIPLFNQVVLC